MDIVGVAMVGLLLAVPWPFWRLAASTPVSHRRRDQVALLMALGVYVLVILVIAVGSPALLPVLATVAGMATLAMWWRSTSGFGRRDGIPPGRILIHPLDRYNDLDYLLRGVERYGPIFKIGATFPVPTLTPIICVVGLDLGLELLREHEASLDVYPTFPTSRVIPRGFLRNMTVAEHDRYTPIFRQAFATSADVEFEQVVRRSARRVLEGMQEDGIAATDRGVAPRPYLRDFAFDALATFHFGIDSNSGGRLSIAAQFPALDLVHFWRRASERSRRAQWTATVDWLKAEVVRSDARTARSVISEALAVARRQSDDSDVSFEEDTIVGNLLQMQDFGTSDLSGLLVWVIKHLGDHPVWVQRIIAETSDEGAKALGERIVRESLRLEQSEYLERRTTEDITFRGFRFPKGWRIRICVREAHRGPAVFHRPTEFDPDRFLERVYRLREYAPFGLYRHRCVGAQLVTTIGRIFVEELARGYRLTIVADGPRQHARFHWEPSPQFRVRLDPRINIEPTTVGV